MSVERTPFGCVHCGKDQNPHTIFLANDHYIIFVCKVFREIDGSHDDPLTQTVNEKT